MAQQKTNQELQSENHKLLTKIDATLKSILDTVGIRIEIFEKANNSITEHQSFTTRNNQL